MGADNHLRVLCRELLNDSRQMTRLRGVLVQLRFFTAEDQLWACGAVTPRNLFQQREQE
jgi:hypothetical protein